MSETLIKVEDVSKKFCKSLKKSLLYGMHDLGREVTGRRHGGNGELRPDEFWAVNNVNFELKRGECLGLIGRNGAGKTTLLRMLNGLIKPDAGRIEMRGRIGALIALGAGFNPILTGRENIYVNASVLGLSKKEIDGKIDEIIDYAEIDEFIDMPVQSYSSGMHVRLGFAIAVKIEPDILLLDEVLAVGDVGFQAKCFNTLAEFRERGTSFILVSHNMHQISRYSEKVLYLKKGGLNYFDDCERGIEMFLADMNQSDSEADINRTDWSRVNGSGQVIFTGARFLNNKGDNITEINVGDALTFEIDYRSAANMTNKCVIEVIARDRDGVALHTRSVLVLDKSGEKILDGCVRVIFPFIPINTGFLEFFFCAMNDITGEVYDWKRNFPIKIKPEYVTHSRLSIPIKWEFNLNPI